MNDTIEIYKSKKDKITKMKWKSLENKMDRDLKKQQEKRRKHNIKQARKSKLFY